MLKIKSENAALVIGPKLKDKIRCALEIDDTDAWISPQILNKLVSEYIKLKKEKEKTKQKKTEEIQEKSLGLQDKHNYFMNDFQRILRASIDVYAAFPFSGKEHHYQAALEEELREMGEKVYQEVAVTLNYTKRDGKKIQLPHDIRGREDLVLPEKNMVLELKQTGKLTDKEFNQICRYMEHRRQYSPWGIKTTGMLINFGDNDLECWGLYYATPEEYHGSIYRLRRVLLYKEERPPLSTFVDSYVYLMNKSHPREE